MIKIIIPLNQNGTIPEYLTEYHSFWGSIKRLMQPTSRAVMAMQSLGIVCVSAIARATMIAAAEFKENQNSNRASAESLVESYNHKIAKRINNV